MIRPKFKQSLYVEVVEPDTIFLLSENTHLLLTGAAYKHLAPLLRGEETVPGLVGLLADKVPAAQVLYALKRLEHGGYIVEADDSIPAEQAAFWHSLNASTQVAATNIQQKRVAVRVVGDANAEPLLNALESLQVQLSAQSDLLVVLTDDYLHPELETINQQALAAGQTWLVAKLVGEAIWLGPIFKPYETACWECMAQRIRLNRPVEAFVLKRRIEQSKPLKQARTALTAGVEMGANLLATEIIKWIAQGRAERLQSQLVTVNTLSMEMSSHFVFRRPQCPICSPSEQPVEAKPVTLQPCPKRFTWDGGHRSLLPEEAWERYKHHISPITGVVTHLTSTLPDSGGLAYCFMAGHGFSLMTDDVKDLRRNVLGRSSGKGTTETQAKLSGIGEAMERYSGVYYGEGEITIKGSYQDLSPQAIHPNDVNLVSQQQYANRIEWNQKQKGPYHIVPKPFDESAEIEWAPFWSLTHQQFSYYPAFASYFGHPDTFKGFGSANSNGCAAGHTLEEAIFQGFLELVERDSVALWWYNRLRRPQVNLDSFALPYVRELQGYYRKLNRSLWVLDITADLNIPTFVAVSGRLDREVEDIIIGLGCHLDPRIALLRSLSEVNQFLANVIYANPDGSTDYLMNVEETVDWFKTAKMSNQPYLVPDESLPAKLFSDYPQIENDDLRQDVDTCVKVARDAGLEVFVLDQSRPDVGMKVCRVLVPGLRHFWRRLAPGRLYDAPVKMGWLNQPLAEEELNPVSMFF